jgi:hypothetical protein
MKPIFVISLFVLLFTGSISINAQQQAMYKTLVSKKSSMTKGQSNPNIKTGIPVSDTEAKKEDRMRGDECTIYLDNRTGYYLNVYLDGKYQGTVGPYENRNLTFVNTGNNSLYVMTIGGTYYWECNPVKCTDYKYFYSLY